MALEPGFNSVTQVDWELACERETVIRPQMPPSPNERDFYEELLVGLRTVLPNGLSVAGPRACRRGCLPQLLGELGKTIPLRQVSGAVESTV